MPLTVGANELLRAMMDASIDCIKIVAVDGRLTYMNPFGLCAMEIDDSSQIYGQFWWDLWPDDNADTVRQAVFAAGQGEVRRFQAFCPTAKRSPRWWDVTVAPVRDEAGGVSKLVCISRDISDERQSAELLAQNERDLLQAKIQYEGIVNSIDQMIWSTLPDGYHDFYNRRWYEFTGVPEGSTDGEAWNGMFHPDDQERAWATWRSSLATGEAYHIEYRLRHRSGEYRWVIGRAQCVRDEAGQIVRWYGTCTDIHDLKEAEAARELISNELSHRIKNIFAVVSSLIMLPALRAPEMMPFAKEVQERIHALALAHEYVRPHGGEMGSPDHPQTFHGLIQLLAAPYDRNAENSILISGDNIRIDLQAATSVALIFHELATNSVKYGALSKDKGKVYIESRLEEGIFGVRWSERGGPAIQATPTRQGFGTLLSERVLTVQLGARLERQWHSTGLEVLMQIPEISLKSR